MSKKKMATREAYGNTLAELAAQNPNILVLDADLSGSTKSGNVKKNNPAQHFNMGIAEGNMMSVAAGMAASGNIVFASSFAMFATGRAYEQIRNSIGYPQLNVKICASHAGLTVGEDGASHQCIEDMSLMRGIPGMVVICPADGVAADKAIRAVAAYDGPCYVRLGRSQVETVYDETYEFEIGKGQVLREGKGVAIVACGIMVEKALAACEMLAEKGIQATVVDMHTIKPIDKDLLVKLAETHDLFITCEEHTVVGGLGSAVAECLSANAPRKVKMIGVQDAFGESGTPDELLAKYHLTAEDIFNAAIEG